MRTGCGHGCDAVRGVGQVQFDIPGVFDDVASSGGIFSSIGNFFSSTFGSELVKAGLTIGTGFAIRELTGGGGSGGGQTVIVPGGGTQGTQGQPNIILQQPASSELPAWVMPAAVIGGLGLVAVLLLSRR